MNGNIKALDDVIREIVFNDDVSQLLSTPNAAHSYDGVVQFQVDECEDNGTSIEDEGFQIGEPFDGDIENAPVLFLSSNPASLSPEDVSCLNTLTARSNATFQTEIIRLLQFKTSLLWLKEKCHLMR